MTSERLRNLLRYPSMTALAENDSVMAAARTLVHFYYLLTPFIAYRFFTSWPVPTTRPNFTPLWSLVGPHLLSLDVDATINVVRFIFLAVALLCMLYYRHRFVRIALFIALTQAHALESSFGSLDHQYYLWLFTSGILIFLPDRFWSKESTSNIRRKFLLVVWWAQASIMLAYSVSGFWKVFTAFVQMSHGTINGFSMYAFAYQVADWLPKLQNEAPLGPFIINHPYIAWPLYLGMQYMQLFAFWSMVRPSLQKFWAFELILFHVGTYLIFGISFWTHIPLLLIFFFNSPFAPTHFNWRIFVRDLPIFGPLFSYMERAIR